MTAADAAARAAELLALGPEAADALGHDTDSAAVHADALRHLDEASAVTVALHEINTRLVPLMQSFRTLPRDHRRWWYWFTGEALEQELLFGRNCAEVERLALDGMARARETDGHIGLLEQECEAMRGQLQSLELEIAAGRLMLAPAAAERLERHGFGSEDRARLSRRLGNLEALSTALHLTQAQYGVAITHAQAVCDRFEEVHRLLLPIWKQRLGFELFSQRVSNPSPRR